MKNSLAKKIIIIVCIILLVVLITDYIYRQLYRSKYNDMDNQNGIEQSEVVVMYDNTDRNRNADSTGTGSGTGTSTFGLYYSPNCGHCRDFYPKWQEITNTVKMNGVKFFEVNCNEDEDKCRIAQIQAYPTMLLQKPDGTTLPYDGERTKDGIVNFIRSN